jgi:hypothetical protein
MRTACLAIVLGVSLGTGARAACLDEAAYARVLDSHTAEVEDLAAVRVDYAGLRANADWKAVVASLAACQPDGLRGDAALAFWINAYNVLAIDLVLHHYPVEGIRDIGSLLRPVWKREAGRVGGRPVSLHEIEHEILRPRGDPRIHVALVCASLSCPALLRAPYRAEDVDRQLNAQARSFLDDSRKGAVLEGRTLRLSRIFDWFAKDFAPEGGVVAWVARYRPELNRAERVRYFDYDWSLNDLATAPVPAAQ